jgi:predicted transcriptional regulator of viral defense system
MRARKKMNSNTEKSKFEAAKFIFKQHEGLLHTSKAISLGIYPPLLYAMRAEGVIEKISRGVYRLADLPPLGNPDLVTTALRIPDGVVCLISALDFHEITTQIPHEIHIAIARNASPAKIEYPPVRFYRFSDRAFTEGIQVHTIDGVPVRIYSPEKTVTDCFKYRNKIGLEVAIEALKFYKGKKQFNVKEVMRFAGICRVEKIMRPYLEAIL